MKAMLAAGAAALAVTVGAAAPARGDAIGCTWAPYGDVCIFVWGTGLYVHHVQVVRNKPYYNMICDYQGRLTVHKEGLGRIYSRWSPFHSGCTPLKAWFDWYPDRRFPDQSIVCVAFFEHGKRQGGRACETIHS